MHSRCTSLSSRHNRGTSTSRFTAHQQAPAAAAALAQGAVPLVMVRAKRRCCARRDNWGAGNACMAPPRVHNKQKYDNLQTRGTAEKNKLRPPPHSFNNYTTQCKPSTCGDSTQHKATAGTIDHHHAPSAGHLPACFACQQPPPPPQGNNCQQSPLLMHMLCLGGCMQCAPAVNRSTMFCIT